MSFVRKTANPPRKKKTTSKKPRPWDDTITDLTAYKATPEEIEYRRASHRSKNAVVTHLHRGPGSARKGKRASPFRNNAHARKIAIMKEVLYDQKQLQDVLEKSDTMMAVVKDLFGDDPRRFAGIPSVTSAPNAQAGDVGASLVRLPPPIRTRSEAISDSMMSGSALNDFRDSESEGEDVTPAPLSYQPKMNLERFQQFLEAEEKNNTLSTISGQAGLSHLGQPYAPNPGFRVVQSSQLPDQTGLSTRETTVQTPTKSDANESLEILRPPNSAMNDTNKVNKTKRRVPRPEPDQNTSNFSLIDLRKVLETLEDEIQEYETQTGKRPPAERNRQETFSGYTLAIVDAVTKLTRYLKECELQLRAETMVREQLTQDVVQFRALVDALTSDIILTQEEFHKMSSEFQQFRSSTQAEIGRLRGGTLPNSAVASPPTEGVSMTTPPKSQKYQHVPAAPNQNQGESHIPREINHFGDHLQPVSAAVMLSPPVRRSRVNESEEPVDTQNRQGNLMDVPDYLSNAESTTSEQQEDSYAELPQTCATSLGPTTLPGSMSSLTSMSSLQGSKPPSQPETILARPVPVNTVSVPRPTPLVQSNINIPAYDNNDAQSQNGQPLPQSFLQKHRPVFIVPQDRPQPLQRPQNLATSDLSEAGSDREVLSMQIDALNKQHAEAQRRLQGLMVQREQSQQQQQQQQHLQQQQQQQQKQFQEQEQQQQRQQLLDNQQRLQNQQLQYDQQQKLIALVLQQQQKIQQQQQPQKSMPIQQNQPVRSLPRPNIPQEQALKPIPVVRQSNELPGYQPQQQRQTGLPAYPVSPNISPISRRSEAMREVYQSMDGQNGSMTAPTTRGITVALPQVELDLSVGSPHSPQMVR